MRIVEVVQGTDAWRQHRNAHLNGSDAPAMMGMSSYKKREQLVREIATGATPEIDAHTQRRFDDGHKYEAQARPWAEELIGEELYPVTVADDIDGLPLSSSLDGLTMGGSVMWEHKTLTAALDAALAGGVIPEEYHPQIEQGLMLSGAERCLFSASAGVKDTARHVWYTPNPALRARLVPGWKQLKADVAAYQPETPVVVAVGRAPSDLPALLIQVTGAVTQSNLPEFKSRAIEVFRSIKSDLQTDEDFADAELAVKFCKNVEERLEMAKAQALGQTASIDALFRAIDEIGGEARTKRLELDKLVKARKDAVRLEIIRAGEAALREHVATINRRLGKAALPPLPTNFPGVIRGLKTIASVKDAVATELARAKIEASAMGERVDANLRTLTERAAGFETLFPDVQQMVLKDAADLASTITARIAEHKEAQRRREEAAPTVSLQPVAPPAARPAEKPRMRPDGPTAEQVIALVANHYGVNQATALAWLARMNFNRITTGVAA